MHTSFSYSWLVFLLVGSFLPLFGQENELLVRPFLQDAGPHSITIKWETASGSESIVEYGTSPQLGESATGIAYDINYTASRVHEVQLTDLERLTMYYYRVKTGGITSDIYQFKTPPFASDKQAFRIVAMSDMQEDGLYPDKFGEMVQEGVLAYLKEQYGGTVPDNLALMMIPGDLVDDGAKYEEWKRDFFDPASELFTQVPVYPVPGNHERNSHYFFTYFSLPQNGTPAYHEHWWYKDYGNIRIIGLDSNDGYTNDHQLNWLDRVLDSTATDDHIDFVFAQLHHPFKSEMWLPGERDFTGKVVEKLEAFSSRASKPSIHFFGHTHAYSRGQSRDHKHLWINVATSGGNIDYWGEYDQHNYDEFTVTQDEYGFVMVDVDPNGGDPKLTVRRYSRGNEFKSRDNELRDSLTVWRLDKKPETPQPQQPAVNSEVNAQHVLLKAGPFASSLVDAEHGASHWQVAPTAAFEKPVFNSWKQHEDWYYYVDQQAGDDLTDELIPALRPGKTYFWRVRYRDKNLNWSDWSEVVSFLTTANP